MDIKFVIIILIIIILIVFSNKSSSLLLMRFDFNYFINDKIRLNYFTNNYIENWNKNLFRLNKFIHF